MAFGEALDFWRVVEVQPNRRLALRAEMRLPGEATLTFEIEPAHPDTASKGRQTIAGPCSCLVMTARFLPRGLPGLAYWYAVLPFHHLVFSGMLREIRRTAERLHGA